MNEDYQPRMETHKIEIYEEEIELIDILRVIWKWKYFILTGTIACGLIAAIISLKMAKIYSIDMMLSPGILEVVEKGDDVYIDSPQNIKSLIDLETFNNDILNNLKDNRKDKVPRKLHFNVTLQKNSNTLRVTYETADINQGIEIQNCLIKLLSETYSKRTQYFKNEYDMKWSLIKNKIENIKASIQSYKRNMANIEKRIGELISEIKLIKNNTANLVAEKNKWSSKNPKENDGLQVLFYTYLIQENIKLSNNYLNEINDYKFKKEEQLQNIHKLNNEKEVKLNDIKDIKFKIDQIQNIQILQAPTKNPLPIKPKTKHNIILALVAGLFLMMFLAFFGEYLRKYRKRQMTNGN